MQRTVPVLTQAVVQAREAARQPVSRSVSQKGQGEESKMQVSAKEED